MNVSLKMFKFGFEDTHTQIHNHRAEISQAIHEVVMCHPRWKDGERKRKVIMFEKSKGSISGWVVGVRIMRFVNSVCVYDWALRVRERNETK
jgi:hypothetical protein